MYQYFVFGLSIDSEVPIYGQGINTLGQPDVTIRIGSVPNSLDEIKDSGICFQVNKSQVLLTIKGVGKLLVQKGFTVTLDLHAHCDIDLLRLVLINNVIGLLLHQRQLCVLQASCAIIAGKCYAFVGSTGCGKSTLISVLHKHGHEIVTDDICALDLLKRGPPRIRRGHPFVQVWRDALDHLQHDPELCVQVRPDLEKFNLPITLPEADPLLDYVLILRRSRHTNEFSIERLAPADGLASLIVHTYQRQYMYGMGLQRVQLPKLAKICHSIPIARLNMANSFTSIENIVETISRGEFCA